MTDAGRIATWVEGAEFSPDPEPLRDDPTSLDAEGKAHLAERMGWTPEHVEEVIESTRPPYPQEPDEDEDDEAEDERG